MISQSFSTLPRLSQTTKFSFTLTTLGITPCFSATNILRVLRLLRALHSCPNLLTYATVATCQRKFPLIHGRKSPHYCVSKPEYCLGHVFCVFISVRSPLSLHKCHPMILSTSTTTTTPTVAPAVFLPGFRAIPSSLVSTYAKTKPRHHRVSRESEHKHTDREMLHVRSNTPGSQSFLVVG